MRTAWRPHIHGRRACHRDGASLLTDESHRTITSPPVAAVEECGVYCAWEASTRCPLGSACNVAAFKTMVDAMAKLEHVRILLTSGAGMSRHMSGLGAMDATDVNGRTGVGI
jgi:hypothetical protein